MKRIRKLAGLLAAGVLASGLSLGITGSAGADVIPPTPQEGWAEIFTPYLNAKACLDVPGGTMTVSTPVQLFHCHGYASNGTPQRFVFSQWAADVSPGVSWYYLTVNAGAGPCLSPAANPLADAPVRLARCSFLGPLWALHSRNLYAGDPVFELELVTTGYCMTMPNWSGSNGEQVVMEPCDPGNVLQFWNLG
jgi:hypothetical protein